MDKKIAANIDDFIAGYPSEVQEILQRIRALVGRLAPAAVEAIAYGIPTFRLDGKNLVHFSGLTNHIGFYPTPSAIEAFAEELKPYEVSKGTVKFPLGKPIPYDLIQRIVQFRIAEVSGKKNS
ncbi:MAG: DUF1801 domain-containing protein [Dehalogenimonas sp.]